MTPEYEGSSLEGSVKSLKEELNKQTRDLVLEHYRMLSSRINRKVKATEEQNLMSSEISHLTQLGLKDRESLVNIVKEKQAQITQQTKNCINPCNQDETKSSHKHQKLHLTQTDRVGPTGLSHQEEMSHRSVHPYPMLHIGKSGLSTNLCDFIYAFLFIKNL